ncbi:MAG: hypothetical protein M3Y69_00405 [Verrucomicrobiota bacterium]|nr:hypothetical protein [Verrucomicrobiota bacterium]
MALLRRIHLYLGCLFAPALIFFAVSGTWQLYRLHDTKKDGSYTAPAAISALSAVHMNSHLPGKKVSEFTPMRAFSVAAAIGLVITTALGVVLAFRFSRSVAVPLAWLGTGLVLPAAILYFYR